MKARISKFNSDIDLFRDRLACKGETSLQAKRIVEHAVKRAKVKANILPQVDSSLLASALEEARLQLEELSLATAANASIMAQIRRNSAPSDKSSSAFTNAGESMAQSLSSFSEKEMELVEPSSVEHIVAPLRAFAEELASHGHFFEDVAPPSSPVNRRRSLEQERLAVQDFDFDQPGSPTHRKSVDNNGDQGPRSHGTSGESSDDLSKGQIRLAPAAVLTCETCDEPAINPLAFQTPEGYSEDEVVVDDIS